MVRKFLAAIASLMTVLTGSSARAEGAGNAMDLEWQAPPGCPDGASVTREVEELLGPAAPPGGEQRSATAVVTAVEHGWSVVLITQAHGAQGRRTLEARSCEGLAHATALVLALTIDPRALARRSDAASRGDAGDAGGAALPPPSAATSAAASTVRAQDSAVEARPITPRPAPSSRAWRLSAGAGAAAMVGPLPGFAFAPELGAGYASSRWRLDVAFAYFPPMRALVDSRRGGKFSLLAGSVRACRTWLSRNGAFAVGPCVAVEGGAMSGEGIGIRFPGAGTAPWLAMRAGPLAAVRLGSEAVWLVATLDAEVPLTHYRFAAENVGIVHDPSLVAGRASLRGELHF